MQQQIGQEELRITSALQKIELNHVFFIKQPFHKATEFTSKLIVQLSAILFAFASTQTCLNHGFATVFLCRNIAHMHILITGRIDTLTCVHAPAEGKSSVQLCKTTY